MKNVVAIIKPFRLHAVLTALKPVSPCMVMTTEVRGYGRQKGHLDAYDGSEVGIEFIPKIRLEFEVEELLVEETMGLIKRAAATGRIGDGKVFLFAQADLPQQDSEDAEVA